MALFALSQAAFYYAFKYIISSMDPLKTKKKDAHEKSAKVLDRLGVSRSLCFAAFSQTKDISDQIADLSLSVDYV